MGAFQSPAAAISPAKLVGLATQVQTLDTMVASISQTVGGTAVPWLGLCAMDLPALILNATVDLTAEWRVPAPALDYTAEPAIFGVGKSMVTITEKSRTKSTTVFTVKALGNIAVGTAKLLAVAGRSAHQ